MTLAERDALAGKPIYQVLLRRIQMSGKRGSAGSVYQELRRIAVTDV